MLWQLVHPQTGFIDKGVQVTLENDRLYEADEKGRMVLLPTTVIKAEPLGGEEPSSRAAATFDLDQVMGTSTGTAASAQGVQTPTLSEWRPLSPAPSLQGWRPLAQGPDLAGWRPLRQERPHQWPTRPTSPPTGSLRVRLMPAGTSAESLREAGWCPDQSALPWQTSMVVQWEDHAREDWNSVIKYLEVNFGGLAVRSGTAVRFRWAELEVANALPTRTGPLFGVESLPNSMLVLKVDLAFRAGDLWTTVESPVSVAVFPTFTHLPHFADHRWPNLCRDNVSTTFRLAVLSDRAKNWLTALTAEVVKSFPLVEPLLALHVLRVWEGPLLKRACVQPSIVLDYMICPQGMYPPPPESSVEWGCAYGEPANQWRVLQTNFCSVSLTAMASPLSTSVDCGAALGRSRDALYDCSTAHFALADSCKASLCPCRRQATAAAATLCATSNS